MKAKVVGRSKLSRGAHLWELETSMLSRETIHDANQQGRDP